MSLLLENNFASGLLATAIILLILMYLVNWFKTPKTSKRLPPNLPYNVIQLVMAAMMGNTNFLDLFAQFGKLSPLHLISFPWPKFRILFINDFELGKELFNTQVFSARPQNEFLRYHAKGNYGIVTSSGKVWEEQRRYTLRKLKDAGVGNKSMEILISQEVDDFLQSLSVNKRKLISPNKMTSIPLFNTLWVILTGERFAHGNNEESEMLHGIYAAFMRILKAPQVFSITTEESIISIQLLRKLIKMIPFRTTFGIIIDGFDSLRSFCERLIQKRHQRLKEGHDPDGFIDSYLQEVDSTTNPSSSFYKDEGIMNLIGTIGDLYIAGGDTAANALAWCILHLIRNPDVQLKIQNELGRVVGRERKPTLSDRPDLPYCTAFLNEVLRLTPISVFSLPHMTTEDVEVETSAGTFLVEKNTTVVMNFASVHQNTNIWGDPENFRPERFINSEGKFVAHEAMITFSIGKRKCPGARLAMDNLYLFVSNLCHTFTLKKDPNLQGLPPLANVLSVLNSPRKYFMVVEERT